MRAESGPAVRVVALAAAAVLVAAIAGLTITASAPAAVPVAALGGAPAATAATQPVATSPAAPFVCPVEPGTSREEHVARGHGGGDPLVHAQSASHAQGAPHVVHPSPAHAAPRHTNAAAAHAHGDCQPTPEQYAAAMRLVADTKAAVKERFAEVRSATTAGYKSSSAVSGPLYRTTHYSNWDEKTNATVLDPNHPEALVYGHTERHGTVLLGVVYIMPEPGMDGPEIGGCMTHWHSHGFDGSGREMLHVWIVDGMPGGPFADAADPEFVRNL